MQASQAVIPCVLNDPRMLIITCADTRISSRPGVYASTRPPDEYPGFPFRIMLSRALPGRRCLSNDGETGWEPGAGSAGRKLHELGKFDSWTPMHAPRSKLDLLVFRDGSQLLPSISITLGPRRTTSVSEPRKKRDSRVRPMNKPFFEQEDLHIRQEQQCSRCWRCIKLTVGLIDALIYRMFKCADRCEAMCKRRRCVRPSSTDGVDSKWTLDVCIRYQTTQVLCLHTYSSLAFARSAELAAISTVPSFHTITSTSNLFRPHVPTLVRILQRSHGRNERSWSIGAHRSMR
jgi:hypothetical protein